MEQFQVLLPSAKRTAFALGVNVEAFVNRWGVETVGFLTLTFAEDVQEVKEAQRRFNSLATHKLKRYSGWICVLERMGSGRVHYHLLVATGRDIRSGVDWGAFERGDYRSASRALRDEWEFWREAAPLYGFGRTELLPVKTGAQAIGRYVGKYIAKHILKREERDKGARLVRYSEGASMVSTRFAWASVRGWLWRAKLGEWSEEFGIEDFSGWSERFGPRWAFGLVECLCAKKLGSYPTPEHAAADGVKWDYTAGESVCPDPVLPPRLVREVAWSDVPKILAPVEELPF